jgi:hypothetical protein
MVDKLQLKRKINKMSTNIPNKIYEALMVEKETRQKFKKMKPEDKTNTQFIEYLLTLPRI